METANIYPSKNIQSNTNSKKGHDNCFCNHKGVLLVNFPECGDIATAEHYCDTLDVMSGHVLQKT
jgi:hypothetical protein